MLQDTVETLKQTCFQGYPESAGCVQGSIDSRNSAIHSAYRISLRPSSLFEPRHPSLKVVTGLDILQKKKKIPESYAMGYLMTPVNATVLEQRRLQVPPSHSSAGNQHLS